WALATGKELTTLKGNIKPAKAIAFSRDGKTLAASGDWFSSENYKALKLWNLSGGQEMRNFRVPYYFNPSIDFSPDSKTFASGSGSGISIRDTKTGQELRELSDKGVDKIAYSPDGKILASYSQPALGITDHT